MTTDQQARALGTTLDALYEQEMERWIVDYFGNSKPPAFPNHEDECRCNSCK